MAKRSKATPPHLKTRPPTPVVLLIFVAAYLLDALLLHLFTGFDNRLSDTFLRLQSHDHPPDPNIVLLVADERSIAVMTEEVDRWPWPRHVFGEVGKAIAAQKPAALIYDFAFADPDRAHPDSDATMSAALRGTTNVYLPFVRQHPAGDVAGVSLRALAPYVGLAPDSAPDAKADILLPRALSRDVWRLGGINFLADPDGVGRRYPLRIDAHGWPLPSMAARVAHDLGYRIPDQPDIILAWTDRTRTTIPFIDFYDDVRRIARGEAPQRPRDEFTGKIVLFGAAATGVSDVHATPRTRADQGTDIMAVALDNLIHERYLKTLPASVSAAIAIALMTLVWFGYRAGLGTPTIAFALVAATLALHVVAYVAIEHRVLAHSSSPLWFTWALFATLALRSFVLERNLRLRAIEQFGRFVNPLIVRQLIEQGGLPKTAAAREVTVLFCDIRGFTSMAEKLPPDEVVKLLNRHFSLHVNVIFRHNGTLDKFIGDAMMAVWGAPVQDPRHARRAVRCALDMQAALPGFRETLPPELQGFDIGIGVHSGRAVVGLVGPEKRLEYTAIGDTVNVASRIEGITKEVCRILVSGETKRLAGDSFTFVHRGTFPVKGRISAIDVYEPQAESK